MNSSPLSDFTAPTVADIEDAALRLRGFAVETPLLESPALNARIGGRLLVKAEPLQRTGSFKFRGAFNRMSRIPAEGKASGVVAYSSGNHAQGVAAAAQILGMPAVIVMPADAPAIKLRNTRAYGAEVVTYDRKREDREAIGGKIARERGAVIVPPYEDFFIIAGQGTIGLEIARQAEAGHAVLDAVLVACSGGGLSSGVATAVKARLPRTAVYTVEPAGFDDMSRSLGSGKRERNADGPHTICDALQAATPGELTFSINARLLSGGLVVSDDEVRAAMSAAFNELKMVVEPGGAVALAAVLSGKVPTAGRTIAVVCSGGNVDPAMYRACLEPPAGNA